MSNISFSDAKSIFELWKEKDIEIQKEGLVDRLENIEIYDAAIKAFEKIELIDSICREWHEHNGESDEKFMTKIADIIEKE